MIDIFFDKLTQFSTDKGLNNNNNNSNNKNPDKIREIQVQYQSKNTVGDPASSFCTITINA